MTTGDWINLGICIVTTAGLGFALIQFWLTRSEAKESRLQDRTHSLKKEIDKNEKERIDAIFAGFAQALKQVQDQQKKMESDFSAFMNELRTMREEVHTERAVIKLEVEHVKESLATVREEVKTMVKYLGEGKFRVSGKKF